MKLTYKHVARWPFMRQNLISVFNRQETRDTINQTTNTVRGDRICQIGDVSFFKSTNKIFADSQWKLALRLKN